MRTVVGQGQIPAIEKGLAVSGRAVWRTANAVEPCIAATSAHSRCWVLFGYREDRRFRWFHRSSGAAVLYVDLASDARKEKRALAWLDEREVDRYRRFRFDRPRREFAFCRAALRAVLCRQLGCTNGQLAFGAHPHGKPFAMVDGIAVPASFNVSHSGNHGLVACAERGRLGVDIEDRKHSHDMDGIAAVVFGPSERAEFAAAEAYQKPSMFLRLWTQKEALIKAVGAGFSMDVSLFEIPRSMRRGSRAGVVQIPSIPGARWRLENIGCADFAAAVACELDPEQNVRS